MWSILESGLNCGLRGGPNLFGKHKPRNMQMLSYFPELGKQTTIRDLIDRDIPSFLLSVYRSPLSTANFLDTSRNEREKSQTG